MLTAWCLNELQRIKAWLVAHKPSHPLKYHSFDAVLTLWMMGWIGWLPVLLFDEVLWAWPLCLLGMWAPALYVRWRARAHAAGRLRCDWLGALASTTVRV